MADSSFLKSDNHIKLIDNGDGTYKMAVQATGLSDGTHSVNINPDGTMDVRIPNGPNIDAFGRFRVSNPTTIFDSQPEYGLNTLQWNTKTTGSTTVSIVSNITSSEIILTVGSNKSDKAIVQSKKYIRYQPSKSQLVALTGNFKQKKAGVRQRIGLFDDNNGMFFEVDENNIKTVVRTSTSGSVTDSAVSQSNWNVDTLLGNGDSGKTLDISKAQILLIDFQALYVGRIRFGFDIDGKQYIANQILNANNITLPYVQTPNLPIRYEIENTTTASSNTSMTMICAAVISEGGSDTERAISHSVSTKDLLVSSAATTVTPIISVRAKQTVSGKQNRAEIIPEGFEVYAETRGVHYNVILNGTITTASWQSGGTNCLVDYDTASTVVSGGEIIASGFVGAGVQQRVSVPSDIISKLALTRSIDNTTGDTLTLASVGIGGSASVGGRITVREIY